jgi:DMSO/TMAO reductase YedYZ molybdopterin-dependent catalytic subunit
MSGGCRLVAPRQVRCSTSSPALPTHYMVDRYEPGSSVAFRFSVADTVHGAPLPLDHGARLRLIARALYGYKSVKHLCAIEYGRAYDPGSAVAGPPPRPGRARGAQPVAARMGLAAGGAAGTPPTERRGGSMVQAAHDQASTVPAPQPQ